MTAARIAVAVVVLSGRYLTFKRQGRPTDIKHGHFRDTRILCAPLWGLLP
jgi:hypothetical protein